MSYTSTPPTSAVQYTRTDVNRVQYLTIVKKYIKVGYTAYEQTRKYGNNIEALLDVMVTNVKFIP